MEEEKHSQRYNALSSLSRHISEGAVVLSKEYALIHQVYDLMFYHHYYKS